MMGPACGRLVEPGEAGIGVGLHQARIARQMLLRLDAGCGRASRRTERPADRVRRTAGRREHKSRSRPVRVLPLASTLHRRVVGMDALGREDMSLYAFDQRHQRRRCSADPIGQRRDVELDAFALVNRALAVERKMQTVFREQYLGEKRGSRAAAAMGCDGAGGWLIFSQARQENFSRTCWMTFHWRGTTSSVSVTSSPILRKFSPPQQGQR